MLDVVVDTVNERVVRVVAGIAARNGLTAAIGLDDGLVDSGFSSIAMVDLMLAIEAEFDLTIPQADLTPETFQCIGSICAVMNRLRPPAAAAPVDAPRRSTRCRQMTDQDRPAVIALLARGFGERDRDYWVQALATLHERAVPDGYPRYGTVLESDGVLVGILLTIFAALPGPAGRIRCNLSSWYVEPSHQAYADLLMKAAIKRYPEVVFVNVSAAPHTRPIIEANGFSRYADGAFYAIPSLNAVMTGTRVHDAWSSPQGGTARQPFDDLLEAHRRAGCVGLVCDVGGERHGFVFLRRRIAGKRLPSAQLVYCEDIGLFVRFAGPLGRALLRRGLPIVTMDANGPVAGLTGRYFPGKSPKYFLGPTPPDLGDLAYTELVLFGP